MKPTLSAFCALALLGICVKGACAASAEFATTRIPHHDASGRATVVEIDPKGPGARTFVEAEPEPIPRRGEVILPPRTTAEPSPAGRSRY